MTTEVWQSDPMVNRLFYGDCLDVLTRNVATESVDLVYLDPPFNSKRGYNVIFSRHNVLSEQDAAAQIQAFDDTWVWTPTTEQQFDRFINNAPSLAAEALQSFRRLLGENDAMSYLTNMAPRIVEIHRVLKSTGSMYLHCDPTMSHYLKIILDAVFGVPNFRNEIIWRRTGAHSPKKSFGPTHDVIFFYSKTSKYYLKPLKRPYTVEHVRDRYTLRENGKWQFTSGGNILTGAGRSNGESGQTWKGFNPTIKDRHWAVPGFVSEQMPPDFENLGVIAKLDAAYAAGLIEIIEDRAWPEPVRYLKDTDGLAVGDIWAYQPGTRGTLHGTAASIDEDVMYLGPSSPERLGYPTQKPVGLLKRIIEASCPEGGIVLDPFCGCGTAIDASIKLGRQWLGIDITYLAIDLIDKRLRGIFGESIAETYTIEGRPRDKAAALALFSKDPFEFERWAVSLVNAEPNAKQVADKGIDGVARFPLDRKERGRILVSVKGGQQVGPAMIRELVGTVNTQKAEMGLLITNQTLTRGMIDAINHGGSYIHPSNQQSYPKIQAMTVSDLLMGKRPDFPPTVNPYLEAAKAKVMNDTETLF